jgi:serine/threonine protein kinase
MSADQPISPAPDDSDDIFGKTDPPSTERDGPLSMKGIRALPHKTVTLGDFRILRKTGAGSMGAVYLAYQLSKARHVALKILP